jgi:hypothetical protein
MSKMVQEERCRRRTCEGGAGGKYKSVRWCKREGD